MTYYSLKEKWNLICEEQESIEFSHLLENIFTKRRVQFLKKRINQNKIRILKEEDDDDLEAPSQDDVNLIRGNPPKKQDSGKSGSSGEEPSKDSKKPESASGSQPASGQTASGQTDKKGSELTVGDQAESGQINKKGSEPVSSDQTNNKDKERQTAVVEPIPEDVFKKFQQKNAEIIKLIFDKSGNGIPETSPEKIEQFAQFRVSPEGSNYDKEVINTITVLSKNISTNDFDKFVEEAFNALKDKATKEGGFPKNVNTVKGYLNEIVNVLKTIGIMKNVKENERNAYALYLAFVFAGGYNFIHAGSTGTVGNVAEAFNTTKNDTSKFFETVLSLSKELPQDEFLDQVTEYVNNNFSLDETEEMNNNFKIYISNVYKLRSLMAKIKKQTKIIQKMIKKE